VVLGTHNSHIVVLFNDFCIFVKNLSFQYFKKSETLQYRGCRGRDRMVVGFTTTCAISTYHH
jgi:hypothetical protein